LNDGESQLQVALLSVICKGNLEITASESGQVLARNRGRNRTTVRVVDKTDAIKIGPGEIKSLT
jgi:hypothetical protein